MDAPLLSRVVRELFRQERIPVRLRWWFVAEGMCDWYRVLHTHLAPHLGGEPAAARALSEIAAPMLTRRYALLASTFSDLPAAEANPTIVGAVMGALHRIASNDSARFVFERVGGAPRGFREHLRAERAIASVPIGARWQELTCHLGELLIALTEALPARMPRAHGVLGAICFDAGARFGLKMKKAFELEQTPAHALELLRMSEYIFRVNPKHWGEADARANDGWLEGTACPWYDAPGWNGAHCGIFGQFQSGISSVFGLRYHLTTTIPRHGGHTCRIDVRPIALRASRAGATVSGDRRPS